MTTARLFLTLLALAGAGAAAAADRRQNVLVIDLETRTQTVLRELGEKSPVWLYGLAWSPDGKRIAYVEFSYEDEKRIYRVFVAGSDGKDAKEVFKAEGNRVVGFDWR